MEERGKMSGKKGMKHTKVSEEVGKKLLRWEREGIMSQTLEENRYLLNFYKEQKRVKGK